MADAAVPPWVGYNEEELMKTQIMDLSKVPLFSENVWNTPN